MHEMGRIDVIIDEGRGAPKDSAKASMLDRRPAEQGWAWDLCLQDESRRFGVLPQPKRAIAGIECSFSRERTQFAGSKAGGWSAR